MMTHAVLLSLSITCAVHAGEPVTVHNFVRAECDLYAKKYVKRIGIDTFVRARKLTDVEQQGVIRMNRDTLYSFAVLDLSKPVTITLPDGADRYVSLQTINQDHYTKKVITKPGDYTFTQKDFGTRYGFVIIRTLVDESNPADVKAVHALQDKIKLVTEPTGKLEIPDWDLESHKRARQAVLTLASTMRDSSKCFGDKDEVEPIAHLLGTAFAWGGLPRKHAIYNNVHPQKNDGKTPHVLTVKDVPVNGFWSITVYNKAGFLEKNDLGLYSINNRTAKRNIDGSITIHFGGDPKNPNYLPIMEGWNYIVRQFQPRQEILDGTWKFPEAQPVK